MIERCIEKLKQDLCGGCARRNDCGFHRSADRGASAKAAEAGTSAPRPNPFLAFLGEVAKAIETRHRPARPSFRKEVERRMEPMLADGQVRVDEIAREIGCSRQTLYRRLKAEGVTFAELLDRLRRRLAVQLLRDEGVSVKEAGYRLGFSDPAAFSRAFKRWTGAAPSQARPGTA